MTRQQTKAITESWSQLCFEDVLVEMLEAVSENLTPSDVFSENQLDQWAEENGYKKED